MGHVLWGRDPFAKGSPPPCPHPLNLYCLYPQSGTQPCIGTVWRHVGAHDPQSGTQPFKRLFSPLSSPLFTQSDRPCDVAALAAVHAALGAASGNIRAAYGPCSRRAGRPRRQGPQAFACRPGMPKGLRMRSEDVAWDGCGSGPAAGMQPARRRAFARNSGPMTAGEFAKYLAVLP